MLFELYKYFVMPWPKYMAKFGKLITEEYLVKVNLVAYIESVYYSHPFTLTGTAQ